MKLMVTILAMTWCASISSSTACEAFSPLKRSVAISPYVSHAKYAETTRPFRKFVEYVSRTADAASSADVKCVADNLKTWARAGAMLEQPTNFEGKRQRIRWTTSLVVSAMKIGITRESDPVIVDWLYRLTLSVARDFGPRLAQRGSADNLYVWSGVAASMFLFIQHDEHLAHYQDRVWEEGVRAILPDGSVFLETKRGKRATPYHLYYLGAILWLEHIRSAQGHEVSDGQAAIQKLKAFILTKICGPTPDAFGPTSTISAEYIRPVDPKYWHQLQRCHIKETPQTSPYFGGNMISTMEVMEKRSVGLK